MTSDAAWAPGPVSPFLVSSASGNGTTTGPRDCRQGYVDSYFQRPKARESLGSTHGSSVSEPLYFAGKATFLPLF